MKSSNINYSSNVYVFTGVNKILDASFMAHVLDLGAVRELADQNRKVNGTTGLKGIQQTIYGNSKPCAYGNGDYTHGVVLEDGKFTYVNRCENTSCKLYPQCSIQSDFREIKRPPEATFDFVKKSVEPADDIQFNINTEGLKVPKPLKIKKIESKVIVTEVEEIVQRNNDALLWDVRPHIRHLADGTTTWVRGHYRGHGAQTTNSVVVHTLVKREFPKYRCKNPEKLRAAFECLKLRNAPIDIPQTYQLKNIRRIDSDEQIAEKIINSDVESRILVNAGPGTGKTHTVIERLKFLAGQEDQVEPESVFVLCFSRGAVRVINDRLGVEMPSASRRFNIATFDSFATWFLRENEPDFDFSVLNYDERIAKFISVVKNYSIDIKNLIGYLIIDEIQDLVGIRALLVKTLLENIEHGFLLLGDECQAIYDYQITNPEELNAAKLYEWIENSFGQGLIEYELTRNHRNEGPIGDNLKPLRKAMMFRPFNEQREAIEDLFNSYNSDEGIEVITERCANTKETQAILSWSNGDAYRQSSDLYSMENKKFTHRILTGARRLSYRREIADILSGYSNHIISYRKFIDLAKATDVDENIAISLWEGFLKVLDCTDVSEIDLKQLRDYMISERRVADVLLCPETASLTISTIHKAKGKEYDTVLINCSGEITKCNDVKVYYVGMTRAKSELIIKRKTSYHRDRKMESGRFVEINQGRIKRLELGIDGDIDPISFIAGDNVAERQAYIASCVKQGDPIKVSKRDGKYFIVHDGHYIGEVRPDIFKDWKHQEPYQNWPQKYQLNDFTDFVDLFVSDVVTIVNIKLDGRIPDEYKKSGFWYGIEFCGYAKPREE